MPFNFINDEQKIRISLSKHAYSIMIEDMSVFDIKKPATFINTIIENFHESSRATLSLYLLAKRNEFLSNLDGANVDINSKNAIIRHLIQKEEDDTKAYLAELLKAKDVSRLYHINDKNFEYLQFDCDEEEFYKEKPGHYIKCLLEDYARLPFIERERIYRKDVFDIVESACKTNSLMQVRLDIYGKRETLIIYPYKIIADSMNMQTYLACFTRKQDESPKDKKDASFSMARIPKPTLLKQKSTLTKDDIKTIEEDIDKLSINFLLGEATEIHVKLTERGKSTYHNKILSRPAKIDELSTDEEYVFICSESQAYLYFYPFGSDAEIISPTTLRERVINSHKNAYELYSSNDGIT